MPTIEEMSLEEIDATMAKLRQRKQTLKKSSKVVDRKVATLERRKARLLAQVQEINNQIEQLRLEASLAPVAAPRRRGRKPKSATLSMA